MMKRLMGTSNDVSFTILRVVLGVVFFAHGAQKMLAGLAALVFTAAWDSLRTWGYPLPSRF